MSLRRATHADSWYTGNGRKLTSELSTWLEAVNPTDYNLPIQGCKAIIAPHAGYSYSGPAAAWAYKSINTAGIKRVFILGPSHHVYLDGCALSKCKEYQTPIGNLPLDLETIAELKATGLLSEMDQSTDEDEHSIEMHLPYVRQIFEGMDIKIVPILVGGIKHDKEASFGRLLAPFLSRSDTFCVVSSDFCHWGSRFSYTYYYPSTDPSVTPAIRLSSSTPPSTYNKHPIHASISTLDHEAMDILTMPPSSAEVHSNFTDYLIRTKNTICGRHPIGVLLGALTAIEEGGEKKPEIKWVRYEQSSQCMDIRDSSVSYASAYITF